MHKKEGETALNKLLLAVLLCTLVGCAVPRPAQVVYLEGADAAVERKDWKAAYRLCEDSLNSTDPILRAKARRIIDLHPEVLHAAEQTFSPDSIRRTIAQHGATRGLTIEKKRFDIYKSIAPKDAAQSAEANIVDAEQEVSRQLTEKNAAAMEFLAAEKNAKFICQTNKECEKAFLLAQVFVSSYADMKIQVAADAVVETYNPTNSGKIGLKIVKIPKKEEMAEIQLTAVCKRDGSQAISTDCERKLLNIYKKFPAYLKSNLSQ